MLHALTPLAAVASGSLDHPGFFVETIWVPFALMVGAFALALFLGKRMPLKGPEFGTIAVFIALIWSIGAGAQWFMRPSVDIAEKSPQSIACISRGGQLPERLPALEHEAIGHAQAAHSAASVPSLPAADAPLPKQVPVANAPQCPEVHGDGHSMAAGPGSHTPPPTATGGEGSAAPTMHVRPYYEKEWPWWQVGDTQVMWGIHVDGYTLVMVFTVALISFCVHVFSLAYMRTDRRKTHYFASLALFTAGMFLMVVSSSALSLLFGWEIMGLTSFLLIGHWWEEYPNARAALKAFFTTRTGDVGLLVGLAILFFAAGRTFNIAQINQMAAAGLIHQGYLLPAAIALFIACIGKSAQFPLHTWLPDAMAGPTPASAIIHAATMVVAGVYMVGRLYPVFFRAFDIASHDAHGALFGVNPVAVIGAITVVAAAALAFVQDDIKKVLAYSTVSQLGYMVLALGVGAWTGGIFHLFTHAMFKALLFLCAGAIGDVVGHSFNMKTNMGGLRRLMPKTFAMFMVGTAALMGIFPFAGFWSKDEILLGAGKNGYLLISAVGFIGAMMTAAYMTRAVYYTFFGDYRGPTESHGHKVEPKDGGWEYMLALGTLSVMSVVAGIINAPFFGLQFAHYALGEAPVGAGAPEPPFNIVYALLSTVFVALGIGICAAYLVKGVGRGLSRKVAPAGALVTFLTKKYYLDDLYEKGVVHFIAHPLARAANSFNQGFLDGIVNGVASMVRSLSTSTYDKIDQGLVDGAVNGAGRGAKGLGGVFGGLATGRIQTYASLMFIGVAALGAFVVALVYTY